MPTFFFPITLVTQVFEDEITLAEALNFAEISRVDTDDERQRFAVRTNAEELLKRASPLELQSRLTPAEIEKTEILLPIEPPRKAQSWREPVELKIHVLRWQRADGYCQAFVPALGLGVLSKDAAEFSKKIAAEIRAALTRTGAAKSLRELRMLERIADLQLVRAELAVQLKTPKQRALEEEKDDAEKSVLAEVGTKLDGEQLTAAYEMQESVERLAEVLKTKTKSSVLLVGKSGVGKTAIWQELVRQSSKFDFRDVSFWTTSGARLVAGQTGFGMWQERCQKLVAEVKKSPIIIHFGNLIELLEVGKSTANAQGIASFLRPKIARGELQVVVECTPEQLAVIERRDANLLDAFQLIRVEEPNRETNFKILQLVAKEFAPVGSPDNQQIEIAAIQTLDAVHRRYATYSAFPGRPVRFLRNLFASLAQDEPLTPDRVLRAFSEETGLPLFLLDDREKLYLEATEKHFNHQVLGQTEAVRLVIDLIATVKAKLTRPRKPIASLLFIGATGVGKTELTKTLAEFFFSNRERLVRFDMSEFSTPLAVERLIGGLGEAEGQLTAKMREQPFSVVLFDEFEKAHPLFFDLLLQILGEGRLTDANGRVADFTNSIIVMTSNLGAETFARGQSGFINNARQKQAAIQHFSAAVRDFLRPEIFNRIDRIVPFAPLDEKTVLKITNLEIEKLLRRDGLRFREVKLDLGEDPLRHLAFTGYDVRYGARPVRRAIERELLAPLAAELNLRSPDERLSVSVRLQNEVLKFEIESDIGQKKRTTTNFVFTASANRAADLRRKTQKLLASFHLTELEDEQFQLIRIKDRQERKRWVSPEDLMRLERLPLIKNFLVSIKNLGESVAALEDRILLEIYGKAMTSNVQFAEELNLNETLLQQKLLELLKFKQLKSNEVCLVIFSENPAALFRLVRCYLVCAEDFGFEVSEIISFQNQKVEDEAPLEKQLFGRAVWRQLIKEPEKYFVQAKKEILGVALKITGELANWRLAPEAGIHSFVAGSDADKVLVRSGDFQLSKLSPPDEFAARGSIKDQTVRRVYLAKEALIKDLILEKQFEFDGRTIAKVVLTAIEENLHRTANNLIE